MSSIIKIKPLSTTYVDSGHANQNFCENRNIFAGSFHKSACSSVMFKSLINFDLKDLNSHDLSNIYLCLYVKDINSDTSYYSNSILSIYKNLEPFNNSNVTWNSSPCSDYPIHFTIDPSNVGKYIKINITSIVESWLKNNDNYGISIEANNYYSSLIKFASLNSDKPPLLYTQNMDINYEYNNYNTLVNHSCR
ncbi:DNRLRE domain-containing protein [Clostridium sp. SM-530-WT-3G]|uniref:DNRLRE domain-containing protein n=1 Tax=Clostridium sp. SM-530-WT-3G TaxID=2725303 RepID=UPI00145CF308|nr:DNRLRE domain-containing protein [Clostridium sp. SM-530-WT-3G]NME83386.1 DNRLRE domain-containing protein [Clostridium sp. SM-530-WT-3G]